MNEIKPVSINVIIPKKEIEAFNSSNEQIDYINQIFWAKVTKGIMEWSSGNIVIDLKESKTEPDNYEYNTKIYFLTEKQYQKLKSSSTLFKRGTNGKKRK